MDFSQGSVTFTVTAQDGVTTRAYFAKAVTDTTDNPDITYPIDEQLAAIFAASKEGNQYRAASGSIMVVDNVTIICK